MCRLIVSFLAFWLALGVGYTQNKQLLYGWEDIPQSLLVNPATEMPQKMHFGIPLLSQIHINAGSSGVSVYDIFQSGGDINARIENAIFNLSNRDFFTATQQLELLNFGWQNKNKIYLSGGVYQEFDFITYFPRDLAILAWEGNANYLDYPFDLGEVSARADLLTVYHFGANKQINRKLRLGVRAKIYSSMISASSTNNQGTFVTRLGGADSENIYEHTVINGKMNLNTSGVMNLENASVSEIIGRGIFGGNLGLGLDLGATYSITPQIQATASVIDLGAIFHTKDVESYEATGNYTLNGIELIFPPLSEGQSTLPYYDNLEDELEQEIPIDTITSGYTEMRPLKFNASVQYSFGRTVGNSHECDCRNRGGMRQYEQVVGVQYFSMFRPKGPQMAGTLFYRRRLFKFLAAKATYTVDSYSFSNVGLGMVADFGKVNFYVAADNLLRYENIAKAKSVSLQLGLNIKINEK